jgi:hypothetical protein
VAAKTTRTPKPPPGDDLATAKIGRNIGGPRVEVFHVKHE